jgi:hypothetical protein
MNLPRWTRWRRLTSEFTKDGCVWSRGQLIVGPGGEKWQLLPLTEMINCARVKSFTKFLFILNTNVTDIKRWTFFFQNLDSTNFSAQFSTPCRLPLGVTTSTDPQQSPWIEKSLFSSWPGQTCFFCSQPHSAGTDSWWAARAWDWPLTDTYCLS